MTLWMIYWTDVTNNSEEYDQSRSTLNCRDINKIYKITYVYCRSLVEQFLYYNYWNYHYKADLNDVKLSVSNWFLLQFENAMI